MRTLSGFFLLVSFDALAADCHLHAIRGEVVFEKPHFVFLAARGTLSETKLTVPVEVQEKLVPFLNQAVEAKILLTEPTVPRKGSIIDVESAERVVPDPLKDNKESVFKKLGTKPCK